MPAELSAKMNGLAAFKAMTDENALKDFARRNNISWYLLEPGSTTAWPASFLDSPEFISGKTRVYHFTPETQKSP